MKQLTKTTFLYGLATACMVSLPSSVGSQERGIIFGGTVGLTQFCQVLLVQEGTLAPNISRTVLSSREAGGRVGKAQVRTAGFSTTTGGRLILTVETPTGFVTAPPTLPANIEFGATYLTTFDVFDISNTIGDPNQTPIVSGGFAELTSLTQLSIPQNAARIDLDINFDATAPAGTVFPTGDYSSVVTVRCE